MRHSLLINGTLCHHEHTVERGPMRIAEIYCSKQGEGSLTGTESVLVRTSGCNLRCWFCDTPYTSWEPEGTDISVEEILERVSKLGTRHVILTGGEPLLFAESIPLCQQVKAAGYHITIETAGTLFLAVECDLMSISPKLSNSTPSLQTPGNWHARHERTRRAADVVQRMLAHYDCQLKFVVEAPQDLEEIAQYLVSLGVSTDGKVWLMPQGTELLALQQIESWLKPYCESRGYHFCPRKHIEWYGFTRGT